MKKQLSNEERLMTDKAWSRLRERLDRDGLIVQPEQRKGPSLRYALAFAATLVLLLTAGLIFINRETEETPLISKELLNDISGTTFVARLEDGSIVYLSENSSIKHPEKFSSDERKIEMEGEAFFDIARDESKPFIINAGNTEVQVLGTSFELICHDGETVLSVKTGKVRLTLLNSGMTIDVSAGEKAYSDNNQLKKLTIDEYEDFKKYRVRMHFKDQSLNSIAIILNRNFKDREIVIDPAIAEREMTATFTGENQESMVKLICNAMNLKYSNEGKIIKIHL